MAAGRAFGAVVEQQGVPGDACAAKFKLRQSLLQQGLTEDRAIAVIKPASSPALAFRSALSRLLARPRKISNKKITQDNFLNSQEGVGTRIVCHTYYGRALLKLSKRKPVFYLFSKMTLLLSSSTVSRNCSSTPLPSNPASFGKSSLL
jgi:hypothetical protein